MDAGRPGSVFARPLRHVVEHERGIWVAPCRLECGRQLARPYKQVVRESRLADDRDARLDIGAEEPVVVGLVVDLMPHADQWPFQPLQLGRDVAGEVDPADHSENERRGPGELEQLACFVERRPRLYDNGAVDRVFAQERLELRRTEPPAKRRKRARHPRVLRACRVPEVLVGVDDHPSSLQSAGGSSSPARWTSSATSSAVRQPTSTDTTAA